MAYIVKEDAIEYFYEAIQREERDGVRLGYVRAKSAIGSMPEADAVEVVRCKDCVYFRRFFHGNSSFSSLCLWSLYEPEDDGYCNHARRK